MESELKKTLEASLEAYAQKASLELPKELDYDLDVSRDPSHGDYSTNIAFKLAKHARKPPKQVAGEFFEELKSRTRDQDKSSVIEKIEVAGAGFINFFLADGAMTEIINEVIKQGEEYGASNHGQGEKQVVEFVSANPTGPLTIAHGRQAAIGDSLVRIMRRAGFDVAAEYYLNDAGRQMQLLGQSVWARYCESFEMEAEFPEDGYQGEYIRDLAKKLVETQKDALLKEDKEKAVEKCRDFAKDELMEIIRQDLDQMKVSFDTYFSESTLYQKDVVEKSLNFLKEKGYIYEDGGAVWFRTTDFGDDKDRVVKKSTGEYTYLSPDIAYHRTKFERGYKRLINLWGPDHHGYVARLKAACQALGNKAEAIEVLIVQLTTLYRNGEPVRMSTRAGEFVTLKELMDEVGTDATRFFFVMRRVETPLDFDLELAKQKSEDNPVYYLQYAHARIAGVLRYSERGLPKSADLSLLNSKEELDLVKVISEFPKAIVSASETLEPYRLVDYLKSLAASFHKFYAHHRVVNDDNNALTEARLLLCEASRITLRNGLELLGISQPESM